MPADKRSVLTFILFLLFILGGVFGSAVWLALVPLCLLFSLKTHAGSESMKLNCADCFVIAVCFAEAFSCIFSIYPPNSILSAFRLFLVGFFWFYLRKTFTGREHFGYVIAGGSVLASGLSIITVITFISFKKEFTAYDMASLTDFKQGLHPFGLPVNDWVAFLLCLLPYPLAAAANSGSRGRRLFHLLSAALLTASILLSLSRGAYLALFIFYLTSAVLAVASGRKLGKRYLTYIIISAVVGAAVAIPAKAEVLTTCSMSKTTSQKLSTGGRVKLIEDSVELWKENPVTGVGQGNFNIVYDGKVVDRKASKTRAANAYALILVERGMIGLLSYCGLAVSGIVVGMKRFRKRPDCIFFLSCFAALCARGLFFSSMFSYKTVLMMVMLVLFNTVQVYDDENVQA